MRSLIYLCFLVLMFYNTSGQKINNQFHAPLDIPMYLSGNFAELRSDHFHSGIDIKTGGVTGKKVFSIDKGFVSRIKIQTNGYGKSVYINHPGGYTSVYGHLESYNEKIDKYLKSYQYRNQTHEVDIYPAPGDLPVSKGEIIALSGNTGSSSGPHLHFEIREAATQKPLNVLKFGLDIKDDIPPRLYALFVYGLSGDQSDRILSGRKEYRLIGTGNDYRISNVPVIQASEPLAFGLEVYDYLNGSNNRCGIYSLKLYVDGVMSYHFQTDKFSFAESRFINAHTDYSLKALTGRRTHNLFLQPYEELSMNLFALNNGILIPVPGKSYELELQAEDTYGNVSYLKWVVEGTTPKEIFSRIGYTNESFRWYQPNSFSNDMIKIELLQNTLYENLRFTYSRKSREHPFYPWIHLIHNEETPMHRYAELTMILDGIPKDLYEKLCVVRLNEKSEHEYIGGVVSKGRLIARIREFGNFSIEADTIPPLLKPMNIGKNTNMKGKKQLHFKVKDNLSGIEEYKAYIDNEWVLLEYDPKTESLFYEFDGSRLKENSDHELEVYVSDFLGNSTIYHTTFHW